MRDIVGWIASVILVLTIGYQVLRQWKSGTSEGVSHWLFVGQIAASIAFVIYSVQVRNTVFIVTNSLMLLSAIAGLAIVVWHRRRKSDTPA